VSLPTITLQAPYGSLVAKGKKTIETRSWSTSYRGRLGIHQGKTWAPGWRGWFDGDDWRCSALDDIGADLNEDVNGSGSYRVDRYTLPLGALVATAELVDVVPICSIEDEDPPPCVAVGATDLTLWEVPDYWHHESDEVDISHQLPFGDFTPGRYAWLLDDIKPTTERCPNPACWGRPANYIAFACPTCEGAGHCPPIPAKGRQRLWRWEP